MCEARRSSSLVALIAILCTLAAARAEDRNLPREFGWDLDYRTLLKKNAVGEDEFLSKWLKTRKRAFTETLLKSWRGDPIIASILIEHPAFHAGEPAVIWLIRTERKAFYWEAVDRLGKIEFNREIDPKLFDKILKSASEWEQLKPMKQKQETGLQGLDYFGFLSHYAKGKSRQMLLTLEDFHKGQDHGRLSKALEPASKRD